MRNTFIPLLIFGLILSSCDNNKSSNEETLDFKLFPAEVEGSGEYELRQFTGESILGKRYKSLSLYKQGISVGTVKELKRGINVDFLGDTGQVLFNMDVLDYALGSAEVWISKPNETLEFFRQNGEKIFTAQKNMTAVFPFRDGLAAAEFWDSDTREKLWGFIDESGQIRIKPQFTDLKSNSYFNDGACPVADDNGRYGYIDLEGKLIIPYQFDYAEPFHGKHAIFGMTFKGDLKYGLINRSGLYVVSPKFYGLYPDGNLYLVKNDNGWGWMDREGEILIEPQFEEALPFNGSEYAPVKLGDYFGFIDKNGRIVVNPQYQMVSPFFDGRALIKNDNDLTGLIDDNLNIALIPQFKGVDNGWSFYSTENYYDFIKNRKVISDYFEIESIRNELKKCLSNERLFTGTFGELSNFYAFKLDKRTRFQKIADTILFSLGDHRSISSKVYLIGHPYELVEKVEGEGFYQRVVKDLELRPDKKPKGIIIGFKVSPKERLQEAEGEIITYLKSIGAEDTWSIDIDSGFERSNNYKAFKSRKYSFEIFQQNEQQYLAIYPE